MMTRYKAIRKTNTFCINQKVNFGTELEAFSYLKTQQLLFVGLDSSREFQIFRGRMYALLAFHILNWMS